MQVDMVYAPFVERFKDFFAAVKQYDITQGRPKLKEWIEVRIEQLPSHK
jgi:glutathione S-transferase